MCKRDTHLFTVLDIKYYFSVSKLFWAVRSGCCYPKVLSYVFVYVFKYISFIFIYIYKI